ncbi:MAG: hypothetical protein V7K98_18140 [Nostoc sp.]
MRVHLVEKQSQLLAIRLFDSAALMGKQATRSLTVILNCWL